jgi:glycosyltransferase involved in cell wall biosynthesis
LASACRRVSWPGFDARVLEEMSALIAIPTYEREALVRHCFATVAEMDLPPRGEIIVFDDASPTLDVEQLIRDQGLAAHCERCASRQGPSGVTRMIWRHFLKSGHEHLLILDSDMIANRSAVMDGLRLREGFDGLLTLYNSRTHPGVRYGDDLVLKFDVGNAGTMWTRPLVELVLQEFGGQETVNVDDAYSRLFSARQIPMVSPYRSRLQHLGIEGTNNRYYGGLEHGLNFRPDSSRQLEAIVATYDELMSRQDFYTRPIPSERDGGRGGTSVDPEDIAAALCWL